MNDDELAKTVVTAAALGAGAFLASKSVEWLSDNLTLELVAKVCGTYAIRDLRQSDPDKFNDWALSGMPRPFTADSINDLPEWLVLTREERERLIQRVNAERLAAARMQLSNLTPIGLFSTASSRLRPPLLIQGESAAEQNTQSAKLLPSGLKKQYTKKKGGNRHRRAVGSDVATAVPKKKHTGRQSTNKKTNKRLAAYDGFRDQGRSKQEAIESTVRKEVKNGSSVGVKNIARAVELAVSRYRPQD
ncbi:MAG: hypothetical protein AABN95_14600 [Acidobacteriota bacterium]